MLRSYWSFIKNNPGKVAVTAVIAVVFLGSTILGIYSKARAAVPQLPAPK